MDSTFKCTYSVTVVIWNICCNKRILRADKLTFKFITCCHISFVVVSCLTFLPLLIDGMCFETNFKSGLCWGLFTFKPRKQDGNKSYFYFKPFLETVFTFRFDFYYKHSGFCYLIKEILFCVFSKKSF